MTNKVKMIFLNLILLAGLTVSMQTALADMPDEEDLDRSSEQDLVTAQTASSAFASESSSDTGPDGNDNCSLIPVGDGCAVCAGCNGQCSYN